MKWCLPPMLFALLFASACQRPVTAKYEPRTARDAARAWTEAYNRDEVRQLRLLMHPAKRASFDADAKRIQGQMVETSVEKFALGAEVVVNEKLPGHEVNYVYHDGRRPDPQVSIIVEDKGRWWVWSY